MKKFFGIILLVFVLIAAIASILHRNYEPQSIKICTVQYIEHPNLEKVYEAFQEEINSWAESNDKEVEYERQIANQDVSLAYQIATRYAQEGADIILALGTPAAQAAQRATSVIPVVFSAITDPLEIKLVESLEHPGKNITGSIDKWPYEEQFNLIKAVVPNIKSIGVVFNPSESNSSNAMRDIRRITKEMGLELNEAPVANSTEVYSAAQSLVRNSDIFFAPADNTVLSALDAFLKVAKQYHVPLFAGDEGSVEKGCIATYGPDYYSIGKQTGEIGVRILNGENVSDISVSKPVNGNLVINKASSEFFKIVYPDSLFNNAKIF